MLWASETAGSTKEKKGVCESSCCSTSQPAFDVVTASIRIIGVPEEEEKKKGYEKIFEEIIVEIFPNMEKELANQV